MEVTMDEEEEELRKVVLHVEVCVADQCAVSYQLIHEHVMQWLANSTALLTEGALDYQENNFLRDNINSIHVVDLGTAAKALNGIPPWDADLRIHVFKLSEEGPIEESTDDDETISTCQQTMLPATIFQGLWESLVYDDNIKSNLLEYASSAMLFADKRVNANLVSWNRVILLHGPPGTGKTSLCKALAHKLSIRLSTRYSSSHLLEINAHSLFSKWFSESGKLVMKLFQHIQELVEDEEALVCVLIDEVESLTAARKAAVSGSEPSDAIRVVNALLTQLDALKAYENVVILTTSNITGAIDVAFVDRADIKQYIGLPSHHGRYKILSSCITELMRVGIISPSIPLLSYENASHLTVVSSSNQPLNNAEEASKRLLAASLHAEGFSGRSLRKIPFQAHAMFLQVASVSIARFLQGLEQAIHYEVANRALIESS